MAQVQFTVRNQRIRRTDNFYVVADSHDYLYAKFSFGTPEWDGLEKTAIFSKKDGDTAYEMLIEQDGTCKVPHEVLSGEGTVEVSVFGGSLITVDNAIIKVFKSGYRDDLESSTDPTPSIYEQILEHVQNLEDIAEQVGDAEEAAREAKASEESAADSATAAAVSASDAEGHKNDAYAYAQQAGSDANEAKGYRDQAQGYANSAEDSADRAEQAAAISGYLFFWIDTNGDLIMDKTPNTQVDFYLDDGDLYLEESA